MKLGLSQSGSLDFDHTLSTEVNYRSPAGSPRSATSLFQKERKVLDPGYHAEYIQPRIDMQDRLVSETLSQVSDMDVGSINPIALFTAGPMGVGKSHVVSWLAKSGLLPLPNFVRADPDVFREKFPEWTKYREKNLEKAGILTNKEAGALVEVTTAAAMARGLNFWQDGSLKDHVFYTALFNRIRTEFPHFRIVLVYVTASDEVIRKRVYDRGVATGRVVPEHVLDNSLRVTEAAFNKVAHLAHCGLVIDNGKETGIPELIRAFAGEVSQAGHEIGGFDGVEDIFFEGELELPLPVRVKPDSSEGGSLSLPVVPRVQPSSLPQLSLGNLRELDEVTPKERSGGGSLVLPIVQRVVEPDSPSPASPLSLGALREMPGASSVEDTKEFSESTAAPSQKLGRKLSAVSDATSVTVVTSSSFLSPSSKTSSKKRCMQCKAPYSGFGTMCSSCRKFGVGGSVKQCVNCYAFFNGFGDVCADCES